MQVLAGELKWPLMLVAPLLLVEDEPNWAHVATLLGSGRSADEVQAHYATMQSRSRSDPKPSPLTRLSRTSVPPWWRAHARRHYFYHISPSFYAVAGLVMCTAERGKPHAIAYEPIVWVSQTVLTFMSDVFTLGVDSRWHAADRLHACTRRFASRTATPLGCLAHCCSSVLTSRPFRRWLYCLQSHLHDMGMARHGRVLVGADERLLCRPRALARLHSPLVARCHAPRRRVVPELARLVACRLAADGGLHRVLGGHGGRRYVEKKSHKIQSVSLLYSDLPTFRRFRAGLDTGI